MIGIKTVTKYLPKTGTQVATVLNDGVKVAKTIIPGAGNGKSQYMNSMVTTFANGKPQTITMSQASGLGKNLDLVGIFNKVWEGGKEKFKMIDLIKP